MSNDDDNGSGLIRKLVSAAAAVVVTVMPFVNSGCGGGSTYDKRSFDQYLIPENELPAWYFERGYFKDYGRPFNWEFKRIKEAYLNGGPVRGVSKPVGHVDVPKGPPAVWDVKEPVASNNSSTSANSDGTYRGMTPDEKTDGALNSIGGALDVRAAETGNLDTYRVGQSLKSLSGMH